jgi:hypothetical protein
MTQEAHGQICQTDPCERCVEAYTRAKEALAHLQRAQHELQSAQERLAGLVGALPQWNQAGALTDRVRALWYRINGRMERYTLDDISQVRP